MADACIDLDAYLARVGYDGPREPTLEVLRALHVLHPAAIPFENLDPLMGAPVSLSLDALQAKLVAGGRGGYCYEQNGLFKAALEALGFQVTGLAARVRWGAAEDAPLRPRSHMLLRVSLPEGPYLADVGFGGLVLTAPLRLDSPGAQATPHERFRLASLEDGVLELQAELGQAWRALYRFDMTPHMAADYEPLNWFSGTHPSSPFPFSLMAARTSPQGRLTLSDTRFTARRPGRPPVERTLASLDELKSVLREDFGLTLPEGVERIAPKLGL
jgi:N-hydroxyarylamine O-acetyltransferase